jgi:hypothetical protein
LVLDLTRVVGELGDLLFLSGELEQAGLLGRSDELIEVEVVVSGLDGRVRTGADRRGQRPVDLLLGSPRPGVALLGRLDEEVVHLPAVLQFEVAAQSFPAHDYAFGSDGVVELVDEHVDGDLLAVAAG